MRGASLGDLSVQAHGGLLDKRFDHAMFVRSARGPQTVSCSDVGRVQLMGCSLWDAISWGSPKARDCREQGRTKENGGNEGKHQSQGWGSGDRA